MGGGEMKVLPEDFNRTLSMVTESLTRLAGSKILVTGAAGFIGSYIVDFLVHANERYFDKPCEITGADNMVASSRWAMTAPNVVQFTCDAARLAEMQWDWIFHAASIA